MGTQNPYVPPSGTPSGPPPHRPPPIAAAPGSSFDFGRALGFFFQDPNWVTKILVGTLFSVLSMFIVGSVFLAGYAMRLVRRSARGEAYPLPEWDDLGGMFTEGLAVIGAYLVHILPVIVAVFVLVVPVAILSEGNGEPSPAVLLVLIPLGVVVAVLVLSVLVYFPAALARMAVEERFGAAFEVGNNVDFLRHNISNYLLALAAFLVANFLSQFGILLFCIGIFPAAFWAQCVGAYALGEVVLRDSRLEPARG